MTSIVNALMSRQLVHDSRYYLAFVVALQFSAAWTIVVSGQEIPAQVPPQLDVSAMASEIERLAKVCDSLGLSEQATMSRNWLPKPRSDQSVLYLPAPDKKPAANPVDAAAKWHEHFDAARARHAEFWFSEAKRLATAGEEQAGYQALWRVLRENPRHAQARRSIGGLASGINAAVRARKSTVAHAQFAWPAGSFSRVDLPHFLLTTRADNHQTAAFAKQLETFYVLWTQVFYPLWAAPGLLAEKIEGGSAAWEPRRQIRVVLLSDRKEYLQTLGASEENIGVSVGYYNPELRTSFFYPDGNLQATLVHELTHQLLAEATRIGARPDAGHESDYWIIEGIAMYMESLWQGPDYWTLGGWESPRLQTARYRAVRDGYWVPWETIRAGGMNDWKKDPEIAKLYTQAAGLTHYLMDSTTEVRALDAAQQAAPLSSREALFRALVAVYQGQSAAGDLAPKLESENSQQLYQQFLIVDNEDVAAIAPHRLLSDLVLTKSQLSANAWASLDNQHALKWLDIGFSNARDQDVDWVYQNKQLQRLSFEGTSIGTPGLARVGSLTALEELDLSGCPVDDESIKLLSRNRGLKTLWLTKTLVTDAVLKTLDAIPSLSSVDIQLTQISSQAWEAFTKSHPKLNRN